jgi:hypothetical protein
MSLVNSSGFKYYLESLGMSHSSIFAAYDFVSGSAFANSHLDNPSWVTGTVSSGRINGNSANFYQVNGSGLFNGSRSVSISGKVPEDDFAFLFCYEKTRSGQEVLLSSAAGNDFSTASGLTVGINDANRLYMEYWNPVEGKFSLNYNKTISSKNLVFFQKSFGEFKLGVFDPIESSLDFSSSSYSQSSYRHSDMFKIASGSDSYWSKGDAFSGYFDDFYCLTGKMPEDYFLSLYSGFYSNQISGGISGTNYFCENISTISGSGVILGTGVTGYLTEFTYSTGYVPTGYFESGYIYFVGTGVTGYENKFIGNVQDACGFNNPVYARSPLTGNIYASGTTGIYTGLSQVITTTYTNRELTGILTGEVFVPIDVSVCSLSTGYYPNSLYVDSGFISSLGFDGVYSFNNRSSGDYFEAYFHTGSFYNNINLKPTYDSMVFDYKIPQSDIGSGVNTFFNNGHLLLESGWSSYQNGYTTLYNITGDIFLDNDIIRSNGFNEIDDDLFYDHHFRFTGVPGGAPALPYTPIINVLQTGWASGAAYTGFYDPLPFVIFPHLYFLNGVKLLSGEDYTHTLASGLRFKFDIPESSIMTRVVHFFASSPDISSSNTVYNTGVNNLIKLNSGKFCNNSSQLYMNGLRQLIDNDYIEISKFDILSGSPVSQNLNYQLSYSSSSNFWNI